MCGIINVDENYYLILTKSMNPRVILSKLDINSGMAPNSFADMYVKKIMHDILDGAINLNEKYLKYYVGEYDSFFEFLYKKELFDKESIMKILDNHNESLWQLNFSSNNYTIKSLIGYENENLPIINQMLGEIIDEN